MSIIPEDITAVRVDQLANDSITPTSLLAHQVGTELKQDTVQGLINLVATALGTSVGVGYLALSVTDGQQLPDVPETPSFFLCGAGTFLNVNGYPNVVCAEQLNAVMSLSNHWELAVAIPISMFTPNLQQVTNVNNTTTNEISVTIDGIKGIGLSPTSGITLNTIGENKNAYIKADLLSANRTQQLPDKDGVFCVVATSDNFANDSAAATGGIAIGQYYHTAGVVKIRLT